MRSKTGAIALSLLLVGAVLAPFVATGAAATSDYSKKFEGVSDTKFVGFDTEG